MLYLYMYEFLYDINNKDMFFIYKVYCNLQDILIERKHTRKRYWRP